MIKEKSLCWKKVYKKNVKMAYEMTKIQND